VGIVSARAAIDSGAMFSQRSAFEQRKNRLELARVAAARAHGALLDLTESNPTRAGLPQLEQAFGALAQPATRTYLPEPFGLLEAREAVSAFMARSGVTVPAENIVLTASTSEAYAFLFKLLCDPGDEVLIPAPSYPLFEHLAQLESVHVARYPLRYDGRWHISAHELAQAITPRTRALVTVHPNNPTGSYLKQSELAHLGTLGLPIVSDEVFAPYPLSVDASRATSALQCRDALIFSLHGLSKLAALPQLKLAWICMSGPAVLLSQARTRLELIADSFLSVSTPVQLALPTILALHTPITDAIRARLVHNLATLHELTAGTSVSALHVEGGWYATLRMPALLDDEAWSLDLLSNEGVLVQPGYFYDFATGPHVVLSLLTPEDTLREGLTRMLTRVHAVIAGAAH
jgi:aspartate/methionine/tyrosine aminotransferase